MRPIVMSVGDRTLVRIDIPGGAHVRFEQSRDIHDAHPGEARGRDRGPAVVGRPAGAPSAREAEDIHPFPSVATLKARAEEDAARIMKPFSPFVLFAACAAIVLGLTMTLVELKRMDRDYELAKRV